jgi:2,3-bisphosphoglycerate-dependent phosphoglycerate mutase
LACVLRLSRCLRLQSAVPADACLSTSRPSFALHHYSKVESQYVKISDGDRHAGFATPDQVDYRASAGPTYDSTVLDLVLLRHGQSTWNAENLFTGWVDVDLTPAGEAEARAGGLLLAEAAGTSSSPDAPPLDLRILHTSVLTRAIRTAEIALAAAGRSWLPVRRDWRLNERHYGDLQGKNKAHIKQEFGEEQFMLWRRSYDTPPPPLAADNPYDVAADPRYRDVDPRDVPRTECLADVVRRAVPYWKSAIVPDLRAAASKGGAVLVAAHGNSIRALRKHLEDIADDAITGLEIPTGIPYRMLLGDDLTVQSAVYLGDPEAAAAAAAAVARQGDAPA